MTKRTHKYRLPVILLCILVPALIAVCVYASTLKSSAEAPMDVILPVHATDGALRTAVPATPTPAPTLAPIPAVEETNDSLPYPFWSEGALWIGDSYRSPTMSVDLRIVRDSETFKKRVVYYVADIHVSDVTMIRTEAYSGDFNRPRYGSVKKMADRVNALIAISGDYCGYQSGSLIIRNGEVYRSLINDSDVCLLLRSGELVTVQSSKLSLKKILELDPWQAWQFGPSLLDEDGTAKTSFPSSDVSQGNPRSCIGFVEPGHYVFVAVDGRQTASRGLTLKELAWLMQSLGCVRAYNLDGGASAHMYWKTDILNNPSKGGRSISDIIYVAKEPYDASPFYDGKEGTSR